jgi:hypothetical protein
MKCEVVFKNCCFPNSTCKLHLGVFSLAQRNGSPGGGGGGGAGGGDVGGGRGWASSRHVHITVGAVHVESS